MSNQEITLSVSTFNQDQLAQLFEGSKEPLIYSDPYEVSESRTYIDENVKMLITTCKVFDRELEYSFLIYRWKE